MVLDPPVACGGALDAPTGGRGTDLPSDVAPTGLSVQVGTVIDPPGCAWGR
jgi:hypothetical protein